MSNPQRMVWRAFSVEPQKEKVAKTILSRNGYTVEVPTETRLRRATRYDKRKVEVTYPLIVGYVFVRLPQDYPWGMLFDFRLIRSIVGVAGIPAEITEPGMQHLMRLSASHQPSRASTNTRASFAAGDIVEVADGAFQGWSGVVEEVRGAKARMIFEMLGAKRELDIPLERLQAA